LPHPLMKVNHLWSQLCQAKGLVQAHMMIHSVTLSMYIV
jgi:hypothetical protein